MKREITFNVLRDDPQGQEQELDLLVTANVTPVRPARISGPPENCYPAEGGEVEIESIKLDGSPWTGTLTEAEEEELRLEILEDADEGDSFKEPDLYDFED
jgi:hypothetical protein